MWDVITEYVSDWLSTLDRKTLIGVFGAIEVLEEEGPNLKRPLVGEIVASRHKGMKELRPASSGKTEVRILFIFDPNRRAILLLGGDKNRQWERWYKKAIPEAEKRYDNYLNILKNEKESGNSKGDGNATDANSRRVY